LSASTNARSPAGTGWCCNPHVAAAQLDPPDLVVVPGLDDDLELSFQRNRT
jgi:hypothetical protein